MVPLHAITLNPPTGKIRGMYVSCGDELIHELKLNSNVYDSTGSNTPKTKALLTYCLDHYVTYLSVYGLGQKYNASTNDPIVGNILYFDATKKFLEVMHLYGISIGIVISNKGFLDSAVANTNYLTSPFFWESPVLPWDTTCSVLLKQSNNITTASIPENTVLNPSCSGKPEDCYPVFERSEMLKQILRVLQYSCWVRDSTEHHSSQRLSSNVVNNIPPDSSIYLFDYMSLEYEYWDASTQNLMIPTGGKTKPKAAWNNFFEYSQMLLYVYEQMCNFTKMELELRLAVPTITPGTLTQPVHAGDTAAQDVPGLAIQVEYLARAFNRILISDYKDRVGGTNIISKTASAHTKFSVWPNDINPDSRHKFMPLFSAATQGEYKHCFGYLKYDNSSTNDTLEWPESFFGPLLSGSDSSINTMHVLEQLYLDVLDSAVIAGWSGFDCRNSSVDFTTSCPITTDSTDVVGFMWFNYSLLNNPNRSPVVYNRNGFENPSKVKSTLWWDSKNSRLNYTISEESINLSSITVYDARGSIVLSNSLAGQSSSISLKQLKPGFYMAALQNEAPKVLKIIIAEEK